MLKKMFLIILFVCAMILLNAQSINDVKFCTEEYPPYNFKTKNGLKGISIEILDEILKEMSSTQTLQNVNLLPWARGYNNALTVKNTCLFSTTRTKARENLFKWVGPIIDVRIGVLALKSNNIKIDNIEDLKKYPIGVVRDDVAQQLLEEIGVINLEKVSHNESNVQKMNIGRIKLWGYEITSALYKVQQMGFDPSAYEEVYLLKKSQLYYAFQKDTPDKIINDMQKALNSVKKAGKIQEIITNYMYMK